MNVVQDFSCGSLDAYAQTMTDVVTGSLQVDLKRRTTLPGDILAAAGIPAGSPLVARVEEPGRIVLESPALLLALLQDDIAAALARPAESTARDGDDGSADSAENQPGGQLESAPGPTRDLVAELLAERAADKSLAINHDDDHRQGPQVEAEAETEDGPSRDQHSSDGSVAPDVPGNLPSDLPHPRDGAA